MTGNYFIEIMQIIGFIVLATCMVKLAYEYGKDKGFNKGYSDGLKKGYDEGYTALLYEQRNDKGNKRNKRAKNE